MGRRIITTENLEEDAKIENHLRPQLLSDYIGQAKAKKMLEVYIRAAKERDEALIKLECKIRCFNIVIIFLIGKSLNKPVFKAHIHLSCIDRKSVV